MKKVVSILILALCACVGARAQIFIISDNITQGRMSEIKATVLDSLTNEPVPFASVYVIPAKDTTITNFTLSDTKGEATLEEVPYGDYVFHVEMLGYKPYVKQKYFRERRVDMGTIRMQVDEQFLQAATITDVGNPIVVKKDTVEFNASSFRVGSNAMLKDLLQRMPGMEITEDGKVKFNGEEIDKLTVGGRTFFFKDQTTALNNLPAAVVDKIRVIDRQSEATRATGVEDGSREKVLDVALKKEYEQGWFGNAGLKGGTTLGEKEGDDVLRDNRGLLYSGNALVSAYSEKDQLTVIGNVQNISDSNVVLVYMDENGETNSSLNQGLATAAQLGVNVNTQRIKDVETTVSANYKYSALDAANRANRTTYQDDGNLYSTSENTGIKYSQSAGASLEMEKEEGNVWFHFRPNFSYDRYDGTSRSKTETSREGAFINRSESTSNSLTYIKNMNMDGDITFRNLFGKERRNLRLNAAVYYATDDGKSRKDEYSELTTAAGKEVLSMHYDIAETGLIVNGGLRYSEPLGEKWTLSAGEDITWNVGNDVRDASDAAGRNELYSTVSRTNAFGHETDLTLQYKFGEGSWITLGGALTGARNETYSKSYGIEETTGEGEWNWFVTPVVRFQHNTGNDRISISTYGYTSQPSTSRMLPTLNISNPSRLSLGNVNLRPFTRTSLYIDWDRNNKEKFSTLMVYLNGVLLVNPVVSAQWIDANGILYTIPVNTRRPSLNGSLMVSYTTPLDAAKNWFLNLDGAVSYSSAASFLPVKALSGLDKETFDYSAFMQDFWGDSTGDRFYGGVSGFTESVTRNVGPRAAFSVKYNRDFYSLRAGVNTQANIARYTLNPSANMNTLNTRLFVDGSLTTKHEFEFASDFAYVFYNGYAEGFGQPEWRWNASIAKNIGAFNLSITLHDILNQTRNLSHTVTANYEEDNYRLVMGRYILFGVKWNFGKMNAVHSQRAQSAAWNMMF